jgi:hypothetical protein
MSGSCGDRAACACVCMCHGCVSTTCRVRCVVELHGVCCDPSGAASASCALVRVVGAAEACGSSGRVGQREFVLKERCLSYKTPCTHRCVRGQEKYIRQCVCAAAFGRNSCVGYCSSSSSSVCCVRLSVRALLSNKSRRSSKSRRLIPARADGRS